MVIKIPSFKKTNFEKLGTNQNKLSLDINIRLFEECRCMIQNIIYADADDMRIVKISMPDGEMKFFIGYIENDDLMVNGVTARKINLKIVDAERKQ